MDISLEISGLSSTPLADSAVGQYVVRTIWGAVPRPFTSKLQISKDPLYDILTVAVSFGERRPPTASIIESMCTRRRYLSLLGAILLWYATLLVGLSLLIY